MNHKVSKLGLHLLDVASELLDLFNFSQNVVHLVRELIGLGGSRVPSLDVLLSDLWTLRRSSSDDRLAFAHIVDRSINLLNFDQEYIIVQFLLFQVLVILLQFFYVILMGILEKFQIIDLFLLFGIHFMFSLVDFLDHSF